MTQELQGLHRYKAQLWKSEKETGVSCGLNNIMKSNHDTRMGKVRTGTKHYYEKSQKQVSFVG